MAIGIKDCERKLGQFANILSTFYPVNFPLYDNIISFNTYVLFFHHFLNVNGSTALLSHIQLGLPRQLISKQNSIIIIRHTFKVATSSLSCLSNSCVSFKATSCTALALHNGDYVILSNMDMAHLLSLYIVSSSLAFSCFSSFCISD